MLSADPLWFSSEFAEAFTSSYQGQVAYDIVISIISPVFVIASILIEMLSLCTFRYMCTLLSGIDVPVFCMFW